MTSNRLVRTDYFKERITGWLSLSGGRLGPQPPIPASFFTAARAGSPGAAPPPGVPTGAAGLAAAMAPLREPPDTTFSFIFETGQHELGDQPIPDASPWATKLGCRARVRRADVIDTKAGYVNRGSLRISALQRRPRGRRCCSGWQGSHRGTGAARYRAACENDAVGQEVIAVCSGDGLAGRHLLLFQNLC
jgi:hypothetical protein